MTALLSAKDLWVEHAPARGWFGTKGKVRALSGVDLELQEGEVLGVVGESGSGKSTLARVLVALDPPTRGEVHFRGEPLTGKSERALRPLRRRLQLVFQDASAALNPRLTVGAALEEPIRYHQLVPPDRVEARVSALLAQVGLLEEHRRRYPHELSGGQRQRVAIARALSVEPQVLIADEVVSALDVSVRAQILELLVGLKKELGLAMVFISHDLEVVKVVADRILVLYFGRVVELLSAQDLDSARHPYTRALLAAAPSLARPPGLLPAPQGEPPSPFEPPPGCAYASRCPRVQAGCRLQVPALIHLGPQHQVACPVVLADPPPDGGGASG